MTEWNLALSAASLVAAVLGCAPAWAQAVPDTGIGPAPTGVAPGAVIPVPAPSITPTPDLTPPNPIPPPIGATPAPVPRPLGQRTVNTFTEQQIRSNLMAQGYSGISGLTVDGAGVWHGSAVRNGANIPVTVDSNGIVTPG